MDANTTQLVADLGPEVLATLGGAPSSKLEQMKAKLQKRPPRKSRLAVFAALDDATARFTSERDLMAQSHASAIQEVVAAHEDAAQRLKSQHAAELESERLRLAEAGERESVRDEGPEAV